MDRNDYRGLHLEHRPHEQDRYASAAHLLTRLCVYGYTRYDPLLRYLSYTEDGITCFTQADTYTSSVQFTWK